MNETAKNRAMVKVAICDDDELQLTEAAEAIGRYSHERALDCSVKRFQSIDDIFADDGPAQFEIVFMDIEFDGGPTGIDAVRRINEIAPSCQVVYLTNYLQYSTDVYSTDHVWFVVKDELERRLPEIFDKLARIAEIRRSFIIVATTGGAIVKLACQDILYLERRTRITRIVTAEGSYEVREKLAEVFGKLPPSVFAYCHSSVVVNMSRITRIHAAEVSFENGETAPISRRYAKRFRDRYFDWAEQWTV